MAIGKQRDQPGIYVDTPGLLTMLKGILYTNQFPWWHDSRPFRVQLAHRDRADQIKASIRHKEIHKLHH